MNWPMMISGLLVGCIFGFVLQHGRFCMNTAFREVLLSKDFTVFRIYILALLVMIIGANLLDTYGIIHLKPVPFTWLANVVGGYIFGIGMVLGGGCATGTLYRVGEGMIGSWFAALGFLLFVARIAAAIEMQPLIPQLQNAAHG
ncbi:MAG: YeeE/YedE thiosulfate transporter family protein, partial [Nitrospirota bacterium]